MTTAQRLIPQLAVSLVELFLEGFRIEAIGGTVYGFKKKDERSGRFLMTTSEASECRDWLDKNGIAMKRIDSGGSPEWIFTFSP